MTTNNIHEGNLLIAEFMGYKRGGELQHYLHYNERWDWLMPVVHKCLGICHDLMLNEWEQSFADEFLGTDIIALYKETIEFIEWYNKNAKQ